MLARLSAFVIWALVAAGLVFWGYRLWVRPIAAPANVQTVGESGVLRGDLTRLLGAPAAPTSVAPVVAAESTRFRLLGVLAPRAGASGVQPSPAGVALIAADGKPARAYAVGARIDGDLVLKSISRRSAAIGPAQGVASVLLELPPPAPPSTGTLPKALAGGEPARAMAPPPVPAPAMVPTPLPAPPLVQLPPQPQAEAQAHAPAGDASDEEDSSTTRSRRRSGSGAASR